MSALSVAAAAVAASSTPVPTPSPSPSITPVVHAVATAVSHPAVMDTLNRLASLVSPSDIIVAAGIVATAIQSQVNKLPFLQHEIARVQDARRFLVAVALPVTGTGLVGLASGHNTLVLSPLVFLIAQGAFYVVKILRGETVSTPVVVTHEVAVPTSEVVAPTVEAPVLAVETDTTPVVG